MEEEEGLFGMWESFDEWLYGGVWVGMSGKGR